MIQIYITRIRSLQCPCGDGVIELFKGATSTQEQYYHDKLKVFLKGSKKKKQVLQREDPEVYKLFQTVWDVRSRHMIPGLPRQYIYFLVCCYQEGCSHPVCQGAPDKDPNTLTWFPGGPPLKFIPLPVQDSSRPWGNQNCSECGGVCNGHYLKPEQLMSKSNPTFSPPPSAVIENAFKAKTDVDPVLQRKHFYRERLFFG